MVTIVATLQLPSGEQITARVSCESPENEERIEYSGPVHLLPRKHLYGGVACVRIFFQNLAEELGGQATFIESGIYHSWAE